jgi:hypothetical protein
VRNGSVRGFFVGILLGDHAADVSAGHVVEDVRVHFNRGTGMSIVGRDSVVRNNLVYATGGSTAEPVVYIGIAVSGGGGTQVINNDVLETRAGTAFGAGIFASCGAGCVIEGNRVVNLSLAETPQVHGIEIRSSSNVLVVNNRITKTNVGILFADGATGKHRDNLTSGVTTPFFGGTAVGQND